MLRFPNPTGINLPELISQIKMILQEKIIVDNLKCDGCAGMIKKSLLQLGGVQSVEVDLETAEVSVNFTGALTREDFMRKLEKLGYPEAGTSSTYQKVKSYVSCAVGRLSTN